MKALRKYWGKFKHETKIIKEFMAESKSDDIFAGAVTAIETICNQADVSKPVILSKHVKELQKFNRTVFYTLDFFD